MLNDLQIRQRLPLWTALSELWLDTELSPADLERIARVMAESGLSIEQLHHVFSVEVAPVVSQNLLIATGEWTGFDEDWLRSQIVHHLQDRSLRSRLRRWFRPARQAMFFATENHWTRLVELVQKFRDRDHAV